MATKKDSTAEPRKRRPLSGLDGEDVRTLQLLVLGAIKDGRADAGVSDSQLARLYALDGKLEKIAAARSEAATP